MVDTLKYLAMGGRIGKAQALLGGVLQFNPIVGIRDGEAHPADRPRIRRVGAETYYRAGARAGSRSPVARELQHRATQGSVEDD